MPQTTTSCPRCRQPVMTEVDQLFDTTTDPKAKQKFLSGSVNMIRCPSCGYQGMLPVPMVYHDADKELLLTYFPPELGLPVNEQERMIGPLITQVVNHLPPEKRKAYLFRPQTMLTVDTMVEKILEGDGITREMLDRQQKRLMLLQRMITMTPEKRTEIIQQEKDLIDGDFFIILGRIIESSMSQGDQQSAQLLAAVQQQLLNETEFGRELQAQARETEAAMKSLQDAGKNGLTREALLDLMIHAPTETRLSTLVGMARSGMDYTFFQLLSEKIEMANGSEKERLTSLREKLLEMTRVIDDAVNKQINSSRKLLAEILSAPDVEKAFQERIEAIDEFFVEALKNEMEQARKDGNLEKIGKIQKVSDLLQQLTAPPKEVNIIEHLLQAKDETERQAFLEQNSAEITPEFLSFFGNLLSQAQTQKEPQETLDQLQAAYNTVLRFSMTANMKK